MENKSRILFILPKYFSELVLASVTECHIDAELTSHNSAVWWAELNTGSGHGSPGLIPLLFAFIPLIAPHMFVLMILPVPPTD